MKGRDDDIEKKGRRGVVGMDGFLSELPCDLDLGQRSANTSTSALIPLEHGLYNPTPPQPPTVS